MTVTTLASGSSGNSVLVSCGQTHILLDAGVSARRITTGLKQAGVDPESLTAIFVTHDHKDHIGGLQVLTKKLHMPIVATPQTCRSLWDKAPNTQSLLLELPAGEGVEVGSLYISSFPTMHDAPGSVGYQVRSEEGVMAICTDLGCVTDEVLRAVEGCDLLVCEANHDVDWVRTGPYPYHLKQRITGPYGHLSNEEGGKLAAFAVRHGARTIILAHLSAENNTPAHAKEAVCCQLRAAGIDPERDIRLEVAPRDCSGTTFTVEHLHKEAKIC